MSQLPIPETPKPRDPVDPAFIQKNIESCAVIGGLYDLIALSLEHDHREILAEWRLDNPSRSALELITTHRKQPRIAGETNAKTN